MHALLLFSVFCVQSFLTFGQHVFFGERNLDTSKTALYFDAEGTIYPDYFIADSSLERSGGILSNWYKQHPDDFQTICLQYHVPTKQHTEALIQLQDSILHQKARKLNHLSLQTVTFLVHGYRKSFYEIPDGVSSVQEFNLLENKLINLKLTTDAFIKVYWDGTYGCCFSFLDQKTNIQLFENFEIAQQNAISVGENLRKFASQLTAPRLNFIAHSLGAKVVVSSLFNISDCAIQTPQNPTIHICLIAPAIGGMEIFEHYYKRNPLLQKDNYKLYILYNEKDFALKKKDSKLLLFGPGVYRYGNTTLGCNHRNEIQQVEKLFHKKFPSSVIQTEDATYIGKQHSLKFYTSGDYLKQAVQFLNM